ncbi:hypothetical protein CKO42_22425 [Lamprobacter modestohalophilus]|uniref:Uncharacterized protein n=1 Tax=Lamprobacter modestohalophilus TaxID=1064514 RepID=A0A9X0WCW0_9GAMM|nr:hypothetical protein [Lamprobacter modestohalophilus]
MNNLDVFSVRDLRTRSGDLLRGQVNQGCKRCHRRLALSDPVSSLSRPQAIDDHHRCLTA